MDRSLGTLSVKGQVDTSSLFADQLCGANSAISGSQHQLGDSARNTLRDSARYTLGDSARKTLYTEWRLPSSI